VKKALITLAVVFLLARLWAEPVPVYFTKDASGQGVLKAYEKIKAEAKGKVAVKTHFGEEGNKYYLKPAVVRPLVEKLKATLVETNVLYSGPRQRTESHLRLAKSHGFTFAPIDILDTEGEAAWPCSTARYTRVLVGSHTRDYGTIVVLSHFKGHGLAGFGGAVKNIAMGLASPMGKRVMHADLVPEYDPDKCVSCNACAVQCPARAIRTNPIKVEARKCIGCGQCVQVCPAGALSPPKGRVGPEEFNRRLAEYAKAIADSVHLVYINVLADISPDCDCASGARKPFVKDIGILASTDPVAIDQASLDLVNKALGCQDAFLRESGRSGLVQLEHGERIGLGRRRYRLIDIGVKHGGGR
jgi:hypothetical protein